MTGRAVRCGAFLLLAAAGAAADRLSVPPEGLQPLQPVPEMDISGAEPLAQDAIRRARHNVDTLLAKPGVSARQLGDAYGRLGAYYQVYGIRTGAEACYANAVARAPDVFRWRFLSAYLAYESGRYEEALVRFEAARRIDADYPSIDLYVGEAMLELNRSEAAEELLTAAVEQDGLRAAAAFRLGQIALERRDFDAAVDWFNKALAADPGADAVYFPLAQALRGAGDAGAAREALRQRGKQRPRVKDPLIEELDSLEQGARPFYLAGLAAIHQSDYAAAADNFATGLEQDPDNHFARISYARALYVSGRPDEARRQLELVETAVPDEELAIFLLGLLDNAAGDTASARRRFERVLQLKADHSGALYFLGLLDFAAGDYAPAVARLTDSVAAEPGNVYAQVLAVVARYRLEYPVGEALGALQAVVAAAPNQWLPRYALARMLAAAQDEDVRVPSRAVELAETLVAEQPIPPMYEVLALAHAASGNQQAARQALETAKSGYLFHGRFADMTRIDGQIAAVERGGLPAEAWPVTDPLLSAPVISPVGPFTEYPAPRAY
jgi:tetratricopeptide (TPR) repeat protein